MSLHYNFAALSGGKIHSLYDLGKAHVIAYSTCHSIYCQNPIQTDTLLRILEYTDCPLEKFVSFRTEPSDAAGAVSAGENTSPSADSSGVCRDNPAKRKLDLDGMVQRGVISRTARRRFCSGRTMSLATLCVIAEDQGVDLLDFLRVETVSIRCESGDLKKVRKVVYLTEW